MNIKPRKQKTRRHPHGIIEKEIVGEISLVVNGRLIANRHYFGKWHRKQTIKDWNEVFELKGKEIVLIIKPNINC